MGLFSLGKIFSKTAVPPVLQASHIYVVTAIYQNENTTTLRYNMTLCRMIVGDNGNDYFQMNRSEMRVNDEPASDHLASDLAAQCGSVMWPLQIQTAEDGSITGVYNHPEIVKRWEDKKIQLLQYFTGPEASSYISATEQTLLQSAAFLEAVKQDLLLVTWCSLMRAGQRSTLSAAYPVQPFEPPVNFLVTAQRTPAGQILQIGQPAQDTPEGHMEIKAVQLHPPGFLQRLEGVWTQGNYKVTLRAINISDEHQQ